MTRATTTRLVLPLLLATLVVSLGSSGAAGDDMLTRWYRQRVRCGGGDRSQTATAQALAPGNRLDTLAYLQSAVQPYYGTRLTRIGGTTKLAYSGPSAAGTQLTQATGNWGFDTRHGYSKRQAWNADETLYLMENPGTTYDSTGSSGKASGAVNNAGGSIVVLDATNNYAVTNFYQCGTATKTRDERWLKMNPDWLVALIQATDAGSSGGDSATTVGDTLAVMNVRTCARISAIAIDSVKAHYIGMGEGTLARDASGNEYIALAASRYNDNPSAAQRVQLYKIAFGTGTLSKGSVFTVPRCSLYMNTAATMDSMEDCDIGHVQLSARGNYMIVHYSDNAFDGSSAATSAAAGNGIGADQFRVFPVNLTTLAIGPNPKPYSSTVEPCDIRQKGGLPAWRNFSGTWWSSGWGRGMNHPDVHYDSFRDKEVVVGGRRCGNFGGSGRGRLEMMDLDDGTMSFLSDSSSEAPIHHVSARASDVPYVFVTHQLQNSGLARDNELVVYSLASRSGSKALRIAQTHTQAAGGKYRGEAHPTASWSGSKVVFASSWRTSCVNCAQLSDGTAKMLQWKDYLVDLSQLCGLP